MTIMLTLAAKAVVPVEEAVGMVLPHDITEIVKDEFKSRAFRKGHIIRPGYGHTVYQRHIPYDAEIFHRAGQ